MNQQKIAEDVRKIIARVRKDGDRALFYFTEKFDRVTLTPKTLQVPARELSGAAKLIDKKLKESIESASRNILKYHSKEKSKLTFKWNFKDKGLVLGQRYTPVARVGLYIPGGRFSYPSTVLMTAIPARAAGVQEIVMVSPPARLTPAVLYAAKVAGVSRVFRVGGPSAVAALAFGTTSIPAVDMIVGPGNAFVNEAKRQVYGAVGIDSLAGPSEVVIIADGSADGDYVFADLMAQAEHDPWATAHLISDSKELLDDMHSRLPKNVRSQVTTVQAAMGDAPRIANALAPEHLELLVRNPEPLMQKIVNAGAIFVGYRSPTALGDYWAGPSHVLPTGRTARFSSGLSVMSFLKRSSVIDGRGLDWRRAASHIEALASAEGLEWHRKSAAVRR